ncbi:MAG: DUF3105 domain-containing protein [Actinomycetota bacterium]
MANKKKRKRPDRARASTEPMGGANVARRERKDEARALREAERKRRARANARRRVLTFAVIGVAGFAVITFLGRVASPTPLPDAATAAAREAGCGDLEIPESTAPGGQHLDPGATYVYDDPPGTSGFHAQAPLPATPRVLTVPVDETQAVHTLEHGGVIAYYRLPAESGVSQDVVDRLATVVTAGPASYLIPYAGLPEGQGLAFTAWNKRMLCPVGTSADQAATIAQGFIDAYACTSNAPEGKNGDGC